MAATAQQIFRDLEQGKWAPVYVVAGDEPFQAGEIVHRLRAFFLKDLAETPERALNFELWDGEGLDGQALRTSLETLPGLFDDGGIRFVQCTRFDKASAHALESLEPYFASPSPTTSFLVLCDKLDRRKSWVKEIEKHGVLLEIDEPRDRDWPRWQGYLEKRAGCRLTSEAWERLCETAGRRLAGVWSDLQKLSLYLPDKSPIEESDVRALNAPTAIADVFAFVDDVVENRAAAAMGRYESLLAHGEAEVKLLALLVRQFRILDQCRRCLAAGETDNKALASKVGIAPFFVGKVKAQTARFDADRLDDILARLAEADFRMKTGDGGLFDAFLVGYFSDPGKSA